jgi:CDP-glucose 4,6-dehydratase
MVAFWKDKQVLVTGGSGFIGSHLTRSLINQGAQVIVLCCDTQEKQRILRRQSLERLKMIQGYLQDYSLLEKILVEEKIDTVFHLGAQTQVTQALLSPLLTYESNIKGSYSLLEACRIHRKYLKRMIVASSDKVYGDSLELPYTEETPLKATYPYDVSKLCMDVMALSYYQTYGLPIAVTRCGNVYGGGDFNWERLIPSTICSLHEDCAPQLRSDGTALRDYIFIEDIVNAYLTLAENLEKKQLQGHVFNFGTSTPTSVLEVVSMISELMQKRHLIPIILNQAKQEIKHQYVSAKKARELLNWKPYFTLKTGLEMTVEWYLQFLEKESKHSLELATCST